MLVQDVMSKDVVTVHTDDSIEKCAHILFEKEFSGLPVIDDDGKVLGMITEGDLIRRAARIKAPGYLEILGGLVYLGNPNKFVEEIKKAMSYKAGDMMSEKLFSISPEKTIEEAATIMFRENIKRLPVVDWNNKLVGIISRRDIMRAIYQ